MMYSFEHRIRYSEADSSGRLGLSKIIDLFQDCAIMHSTDVGLDYDTLKNMGKVWVLSSWQVEIIRMPKTDEFVRVCTMPYYFRGFIGCRNFILETREGERLAIANSEWTLVSPTDGRPTRVPPELEGKYGIDEKLDMNYKSRKIKLPEELVPTGARVPIRRHMQDNNGHVNNAQYVRMAEDCMPENFECRSIRVDYKKPAFYGMTLVPKANITGNVITVALMGEDDSLFASVEFEG